MKKNILLILAITSLAPVLLKTEGRLLSKPKDKPTLDPAFANQGSYTSESSQSTQNFNQLLISWIIAHNSKSLQANKSTSQLKNYINTASIPDKSTIPSQILSTVIQNGDYSMLKFCFEGTTNASFKAAAKQWVPTNHSSILGLVNPSGKATLSTNQKKIINFLNQYIVKK